MSSPAPISLRGRTGGVLVYSIIMMVALILLSTLAVDWGRAQLVKTELQSAADAAARQGCSGLKTSVSYAQSRAVWAAGLNAANGSAVTLDTATDIEFGTWDPSTRTFNALTGTNRLSATAVRVYARRTTARSNPVPVSLARALRINNTDVTTVAIAARGNVVNANVSAKGSPWLAGMPNGSTIPPENGNDTGCVAPTNSPSQITGLPLVPGQPLYFRQVSGQTSYEDSGTYGPDGQTDWIVRQTARNGINSTKAPIMSLVGIFLDNRAPNTYAMAAEPDFSSEGSRNFSSLSPALKQVFFIGDGMNSSGVLQSFVVPNGATRLYLGLMDENGWWWDNVGTLKTTMLDDNITLVK